MLKAGIILLILIVLMFGAYLFINQTKTTQEITAPKQTGLANPASVYCIDQGGSLDIVTEASSGGEIGICSFPDGRSCEEWSFFRTKVCKN